MAEPMEQPNYVLQFKEGSFMCQSMNLEHHYTRLRYME